MNFPGYVIENNHIVNVDTDTILEILNTQYNIYTNLAYRYSIIDIIKKI